MATQSLLGTGGILTPDTSWRDIDARRVYEALYTTSGSVFGLIQDDFTRGKLAIGDTIHTAAYRQGTQYGGASYSLVAAGTGTHDAARFINFTGFQLAAIFGSPVDVMQFGAFADGATDSTNAIRAALAYASTLTASSATARVTAPGIRFRINADFLAGSGLSIPSNVTLEAPGAVFQAATNNLDTYAVIRMWSVTNAHIVGPIGIIGDRSSHTGSTGEWGMGIDIRATTDCSVSDVDSSLCWGDGYYLGSVTNVPNVRLRITNPSGSQNRRNGMSIIGLQDSVISSPRFRATAGTAPQAGIDIEPNTGDSVLDVEIDSPDCDNNQYGIIITDGNGGTVSRVRIRGGQCDNNNNDGLLVQGNIQQSSVIGLDLQSNQRGATLAPNGSSVALTEGEWQFGVVSNNNAEGVLIQSAGVTVGADRVTRNGTYGFSIAANDVTIVDSAAIDNTTANYFASTTVTGPQLLRCRSEIRSVATQRHIDLNTATGAAVRDSSVFGAAAQADSWRLGSAATWDFTTETAREINLPMHASPATMRNLAMMLGLSVPVDAPGNAIAFTGSVGSHAITPHRSDRDLTGSFDLRAHVTFASYTPTTENTIIGKWGTTRSFLWVLQPTSGFLRLYYSLDGTAGPSATSTVALTAATEHIRVTRSAVTGVVTFYTSTDGMVWNQLGAAVAATAGRLNVAATQNYWVAERSDSLWQLNGSVSKILCLSQISGSSVVGGIPVLDLDPVRDGWTSGALTSASTRESWTITP